MNWTSSRPNPRTCGYGIAGGFSESMQRTRWCLFCSQHRMTPRKVLLLTLALIQILVAVTSSIINIVCSLNVHVVVPLPPDANSMENRDLLWMLGSPPSQSLAPQTSISATAGHPDSRADAAIVANVIILLLCVSCVTHLMRGVFKENGTEITAFVLTLTTASLFSVIEYRTHLDAESHTLSRTASMFTMVIGTPVLILVSKWTASQFRCQRIIGAADSLRAMYEERTHVLTIMRLDLVFVLVLSLVSFSLNDCNLVSHPLQGLQSHPAYLGYYMCAAIAVLSLLKWLIGRSCLLRESNVLVYLYVVLTMVSHLWIPVQLLACACFDPVSCGHRFEFSCLSLAAGVIVVVDQVYIMICLMRVFRNFGYGLTDGDFLRLISESTSLLAAGRRSRGLNYS